MSRVSAHTPLPAKAPPRARRRRRSALLVAALFLLAAIVLLTSHLLDEPLRRMLERKINGKLTGYTATLGHAHLNVFALSLTLRDAVVRQDENPEPPVADLPRLRASVEWKELLTFHLVADVRFDQPHVHVDLAQFRSDEQDAVPLRQRGWQQALEAIFPLKFNHFDVRDGSLAYIDDDPAHPLLIAHWNLQAENVRNVHSPERAYPSTVHSDGEIFEQGRGSIDGQADFLAEPFPAVKVTYAVSTVPLERLRLIAQRANLSIRGGLLTSAGGVEYGPSVRDLHADTVSIQGLVVDYVHTDATAVAERQRATAAVQAAKSEQTPVRIERFELVGAELGFVNRTRKPEFRVFVDHLDLSASHLTLGPVPGPMRAEMHGRFMGTGTVHATADARSAEDFAVAVAIEKADLTRLNELLRAYGRFDVAKGEFAVYSELRGRQGRLTGYVKPLFTKVDVFSSEQDRHKSPLRRLYEHAVDAAARLLKNRQKGDVATRVELSGSLDDPKSSAWQIAIGMVSNAFVRAILPGFDREIARIAPRLARPSSHPARDGAKPTSTRSAGPAASAPPP